MEIKKKRKRGRPRLSDAEKKARAKARAELKKLKEKEKSDRQAEKLKKIEYLIITPRGKCPVPLLSTDKDAVRVWLKNLQAIKFNGRQTVQSISYWIRDFYSVFSEEHKIVKQHVIDLAHEFDIPDFKNGLKKIHQSVLKEIKGEENAKV